MGTLPMYKVIARLFTDILFEALAINLPWGPSTEALQVLSVSAPLGEDVELSTSKSIFL